MNKLLFSLPVKEKAKVSPGTQWTHKNSSNWPIKTFITQQEENVNRAIDYYYQKAESFLNVILNNLNTSFNQSKNIALNKEKILNILNSVSENLPVVWETIQSKSSQDLLSSVRKLNEITQQLDVSGESYISIVQILKTLSGNESLNSKQFPGRMNIKQFQQLINSYITHSQKNSQSLGGARSNLLGEIFEIGINESIAFNSSNLIKILQTGSKTALLPSGNIRKVKSDGILSVYQNISIQQDSKLRNVLNINGKVFPLEGSNLYDLSSKGGLTNALNTFNNGMNKGIIGNTIKSWTGRSGSFAKFSISANEINSRSTIGKNGLRISDFFTHKEDFVHYTGYVISKYLINIIGVWNALITSGSFGMQFTYKWLIDLYNDGYMFKHSVNLKNSAVSKSGSEYGEIYQAREDISIGPVA